MSRLIVNDPQYQLKDSLTAHIDQSEVDAVRPLISFR